MPEIMSEHNFVIGFKTGSAKDAVARLKSVWNAATLRPVAVTSKSRGRKNARKTKYSIPPNTLKTKLKRAVVFAPSPFLSENRKTVEHEPIFAPTIKYVADKKSTPPLAASMTKTAERAEDDDVSAAIKKPFNSSIGGLFTVSKVFTKESSTKKKAHSDIMKTPLKTSDKPNNVLKKTALTLSFPSKKT